MKRLSVEKKPGAELSADVGTKAGITAVQMWTLLGSFGVTRAEGRASAQLAVADRLAPQS